MLRNCRNGKSRYVNRNYRYNHPQQNTRDGRENRNPDLGAESGGRRFATGEAPD